MEVLSFSSFVRKGLSLIAHPRSGKGSQRNSDSRSFMGTEPSLGGVPKQKAPMESFFLLLPKFTTSWFSSHFFVTSCSHLKVLPALLLNIKFPSDFVLFFLLCMLDIKHPIYSMHFFPPFFLPFSLCLSFSSFLPSSLPFFFLSYHLSIIYLFIHPLVPKSTSPAQKNRVPKRLIFSWPPLPFGLLSHAVLSQASDKIWPFSRKVNLPIVDFTADWREEREGRGLPHRNVSNFIWKFNLRRLEMSSGDPTGESCLALVHWWNLI